jgi:hypothetical protein
MDLAQYLATVQLDSVEIRRRAAEIHQHLVKSSRQVVRGNFEAIQEADLRTLFHAYDAQWFQGRLQRALGSIPLSFRLSQRLTSTAGKTTRRRAGSPAKTSYEISISTTLLFQTFHDVSRPVLVSGVSCTDRLDALQRVFEHELLHLAEMLSWSDSNCSGRRFQSIASRLFGHQQHTHQLITQSERAWTRFGLKIGDPVRFRIDDRHLVGTINRITRRATVLVEDPRGPRYTDGKRYAKYYVPLSMLEPARLSPRPQ